MCKACGDKKHFVMTASDNWDADIKRIAKLLHAGKLKPGDVDPVLIQKIAKILMSGVFEGYGKNFGDRLTVEEFGTLKALERNVYVFSGFKTEKQLRDCALMLVDDEGDFKPFNQFLKDVRAVNTTYNEAYLSAEYSNTIASAQAISFWEESERNKEFVKNLTWRSAGDGRVRPKHAILDGLTRAKDDPFWKKYFIPLDWGCRCDVEESNEEVTDLPELLPKVPPMFQNNVGITGIIFPDTHPYFEAPKEIKTKVEAVAKDLTKKEEYQLLKSDDKFKNSLESTKTLSKQFSKLDKEEVASIHLYSNDGYTSLNKDLWNDKIAGFNKTFENTLNRALDKLPKDDSPILYRGASLPKSVIDNYKSAFENGSDYVEKAFTSTSRDATTPSQFGAAKKGETKTVFFIQGKNGRYIDPLSEYGTNFQDNREEEVLFKSNSKFKVVRVVDMDDESVNIYMKEID